LKRMQYLALATLWVACSAPGEDSRGLAARDAAVPSQPTDEDEDAGEASDDASEPADEDASPTEGDASVPASEGCSFDPGAAPMKHSSTITQDQTWGAGLHLIEFYVSVRSPATLTIAPCAVVRVRVGQGIEVRGGGKLIAEGTSAEPIRFESEKANESWSTFQVFEEATAHLAHVTISGAGVSNDTSAAALSIRGTLEQPVVRVQHVTIDGAPKFGVRLDPGALFMPDSMDLTVKGAGEFPVISYPSGVGSLPSGTYTGNARDEILIVAGNVERDATWRDLGVPYHVGRIGSRNTSLRVAMLNGTPAPGTAPVLSIEAGVELRFEPAAIMEVEHFTGSFPASGALRVLGSTERPVLFTSSASPPAPGDWGGIWFGGVPDARNLIDHARIEYAGGVLGAQNHSCDNPVAPPAQRNRDQAAVLVMGPPSSGFVQNTRIVHSAGNGIQRGYFGAPVDFLASNTFENVAWCQESYPRPPMGSCPVEVPCPR
jgi:hypothetical protein